MTKAARRLRVFIFLIFFFCALAIFVIVFSIILGDYIIFFVVLLVFNVAT